MKKLISMIVIVMQLILIWSVCAYANNIQNLRGTRYCEIFLGKNQWTSVDFQVYNTIGLNNCSPQLWHNIDLAQLKKQTDMSFVHLNGPRYWVIDGMKNSTFVNPQPRVLAGIAMREAAVLPVKWRMFWIGKRPYTTHIVSRNTTWVYNAGKPIYELVDAKGRVFVMQSYSSQKVVQTLPSLANLGGKLKLPEGWSFRTRVLKQEAYLTPVAQKAVVVQDNFLNTYQQETPGFDSK